MHVMTVATATHGPGRSNATTPRPTRRLAEKDPGMASFNLPPLRGATVAAAVLHDRELSFPSRGGMNSAMASPSASARAPDLRT